MNTASVIGSNTVAGLQPMDHHIKLEVCTTRPKYRQGKEFKAVKVYTVDTESRHLLIQGIPAVGLGEELQTLCEKFGPVEAFELIPNYPNAEEFTHVFYLKYGTLREARHAKKKMDNRSFYGGIIHICYAPEFETVAECGEKLRQRKQYVRNYNPTRNSGPSEIKQHSYPDASCPSIPNNPIVPVPQSSRFHHTVEKTALLYEKPQEGKSSDSFPLGETGRGTQHRRRQWSMPMSSSGVPAPKRTSYFHNTISAIEKSSFVSVPGTVASNCNNRLTYNTNPSHLPPPQQLNPHNSQESYMCGIRPDIQQIPCSHSQQQLSNQNPPQQSSSQGISMPSPRPCAETVTAEKIKNTKNTQQQFPFIGRGARNATLTNTITPFVRSSTSTASGLNPRSTDEVNEIESVEGKDDSGNEPSSSSSTSIITTTGNGKKKLIELKDKEPNRIVFHKGSRQRTHGME